MSFDQRMDTKHLWLFKTCCSTTLLSATAMIEKAAAMRSQADLWEEQDAALQAANRAPLPVATSVLDRPDGCGLAPGDVAWAFLKGSSPWPCVVLTKEEALRQGVSKYSGNKV